MDRLVRAGKERTTPSTDHQAGIDVGNVASAESEHVHAAVGLASNTRNSKRILGTTAG